MRKQNLLEGLRIHRRLEDKFGAAGTNKTLESQEAEDIRASISQQGESIKDSVTATAATMTLTSKYLLSLTPLSEF